MSRFIWFIAIWAMSALAVIVLAYGLRRVLGL
jgi:hypothetical protein